MKFLVPELRSLIFRSVRKYCSEAVQTTNSVATQPASTVPLRQVPVINVGDRKLPFLTGYEKPRQAWVESFDTVNEKKLGLVDLHPSVFGEMPRIDVIQDNIRWQRLYRYVSYAHTKVRAEVRGGGRKPWPQKGMGRARHGSIRSPLFRGGGIVHGPRSPTSHFYMLPYYQRVLGLTSTLSIKLAQDDLHIIPDLEIPTDDPEFIEDLIRTRNWGVSVLIVDADDIMPRNITIATDDLKNVNLMPVYGLNVFSMLKHETLVLTLSALEMLEERLLFQLNRPDGIEKSRKFKVNQV